MKRIAAVIICVLLAAACFTGCGSNKQSGSGSAEPQTSKADTGIVGTWIETTDNLGDGYVFNADGTGDDTLYDLEFKYTAANGELHIEYKEEIWGTRDFTYTIEEDILTLTEKVENPVVCKYKKSENSTEAK